MTSAQMPKSRARSGRPGPGEMITLSYGSRSAAVQPGSSLRTTVGATPVTAPTWWTRL
jgi:hypothetical protein